MTDSPAFLLDAIHADLGAGVDPARLCVTGTGSLDSIFPITDLAAASVGAAALAAATFVDPDTPPAVTVDRDLASHWFGWSLRPHGWSLPSPWDLIAGDYPTADGWIRLHTNAPHHRDAALRALGLGDTTDRDRPDRDTVADAVAGRGATELEAAVIAAGGCAAEMRTIDAWRAHPQGAAVTAEPLMHLEAGGPAGPLGPVPRDRPLAGIRVLDLTRVLAGPVATRFLALLGAEVLRIDPPDWDEPAVIPEVTPGKRCAHLDLRTAEGHTALTELLRDTDVFVHGYRPGALAGLDFDPATLDGLRPGLIDVALDAYGSTGPWAHRRGFDSLVQMSTGIAAAGMDHARADQPVPLPVQALDHATGYLMAAAALTGLHRRRTDATGSRARLSLARTAALLVDAPGPALPREPLAEPGVDPTVETTAWGPAHRVRPPIAIDGVTLAFDRPAAALGSSPPTWTG